MYVVCSRDGEYRLLPHMIIFFISMGTFTLFCFYYGDVELLCPTIQHHKPIQFPSAETSSILSNAHAR